MIWGFAMYAMLVACLLGSDGQRRRHLARPGPLPPPAAAGSAARSGSSGGGGVPPSVRPQQQQQQHQQQQQAVGGRAGRRSAPVISMQESLLDHAENGTAAQPFTGGTGNVNGEGFTVGEGGAGAAEALAHALGTPSCQTDMCTRSTFHMWTVIAVGVGAAVGC
eukprot:COSAG06_NODE_449_length_15623_cov_50.097204_2_plen_164_part_00